MATGAARDRLGGAAMTERGGREPEPGQAVGSPDGRVPRPRSPGGSGPVRVPGAREAGREPVGQRGFRALLSRGQWDLLVAEGALTPHESRQRLLLQGDPGEVVLLCVAGRVKVVYSEPDGREILLAVRGPGDVLGEFAAQDKRPRSATVQAIERGATSRLSAERFDALVGRCGVEPALRNYVMGKFRESFTHTWRVAHRTAADQLTDLLVKLVGAAGPEHPSATTIPMSQEELAAALGLARSAVTPVLAEWKAAGLVRIARGVLQVVDLAALIASRPGESG
ncbi:transcriptional regulator, Crp/Fnr family [Actinosynnema pretiosum subsp. pretiosum]|nr:transcriptional regulator, Crp/Fnr family [Actinosynnema pretiosum subsp. pretiosum]